MNQFQQDDSAGRLQFKNDFSKHYIIKDTSEFECTDLLLTGRTKNNIYNVELKKRKYSINELSGSTIIEETKVQAFIEKHKDEPQRRLVYFNYYKDGSWIAYDITGRIENEGLGDIYFMELPRYTSINGGNKVKEVRYLSYTNNNNIKDKMKIRK